MRKAFLTLFSFLLSIGLYSQSISVTQPNGGELLYGCQTYVIKWNSSGVSNWYDIHYSLDGGTIWSSVATNINITNNQYNWTVPMINSSTVLVRVMDHQTPTKRDSSNAYFTVQLPINITSPNGGEVWQGLSTHTITWTPAGTSGVFNIFYSVDNGSNWLSVVSNINSNNYVWTVPNNPSTTCLVKVQDATTSCQNDLSNAVFEISPAIPVLTAPNGGEVWTINSSRNISWNPNTIASGSNVKLEWSVDSGVNYNSIIASTSNTGSYAWTIPNTPSNQCFVRISNANGLTVNDASNSAFTIKWPNDFITSPNGGEIWRSQNTYNITWNATAFVSNVKIEYSANNGAVWNTIAANATNNGSYSWVIPQMLSTTQALIRITNNTWPSSIIDTSNAVFTIQAPITLDYPSLSTSLTTCSSINIQWSRTTNFVNYSESSTSYRNFYELYYKVDNGSYNYITTVYNTSSLTGYSQSWTVPDVAPSTIKILIKGYWNTYQYGSPAVLYWQDSSDVAATAVNPSGTITVLTPNGGVSMNALTNYNITWTADGTSGFYDLMYSTNGGASYGSIVSNITGTSYTWNVVNNPGSNVFVRVRDNQNTCRKDASDASNTIVVATPALTSPNGGELWNVNSAHNITWNTSTIITGGSVYIEFSTDNGTNWNIVTPSTSNTGSYSWTLPNTPTTQALIRISNLGYPSNYDVSNGTFTIQTPADFLTYPNGGETLRSQQPYNITWDANTFVSNVKLEYSLNSGISWNTITNSASNSGIYSWTTPQIVTTATCLVRITNTTVGTIQDVSNAVFTIQAPITLDYPSLSTSLTTCSSINIQWSRTTNFVNYSESSTSYRNFYELYYKVDNGSYNYITTVYNTSSLTGYSQSWTVPDVAPSTIKILIKGYWNTYQYGSPAVLYWQDSSDVAATAVNPSGTITVLTPNGGVSMNALTNYNITWTADGTSGFYDLMYSTNGGASYGSIVSNITGTSYTWNVVNNPGSNVFVRVRDNQNTCRKDASDASNTIVVATPALTSPNGGELWNVNSAHNITWNTSTIITGGSVYIEFSTDNGTNWNIVTPSTSNTGSYSWTLPNTPTTQALIRISNLGYPSNYDVSNGTFTIQTPADFLTYPNGGETLRSQQPYNITWDANTFVSNVKLEYSLNSGISWNTITNSASNSGIYSWTTPQIVTTATCLVRITNTTVGTIQDVSNAVFTIQAPITLDYPSLSTSLTTCSSINIQWSRTTNFVNYSESSTSYRNFYELYYKVDNGSYNYITTVYNTSSLTGYSQSWTVPDVAPSTIKILIKGYWNTYQYGSPAVLYWQDSSDVAATAVNPSGTITVLTPNGGVSMNALTNYNITWTADGTSGFYDLMYSTNGGASYGSIVSNITGTSYTWNVVNNPGSNVFVRVRDNQNTCRKDASDASNTIVVATPALTSPNGGELWNVNSAHNITWNTSTIITGGSVYIEFSTDNGTNWNIVTPSTSNTGSYSWTLPNTPTTQALIRISNLGYPSNYDVSNGTFTIQTPADFLTYPNGGETLRSQQPYNITWDANTFVSNVKLEYSLNSGISWNTITNSASNSGIYSWTTPQIVTTATCLVRITNTTVGTIQDVSNAVFTIQAPITLDYPSLSTSLTTCSSINIQWSRTTNFVNYSESSTSYRNFYELYYKVDNGSYNYITTVYNTSSLTGYSQSWTVPDVAPSTIKILIKGYWNTYQYGSPAVLYWQDSSDVAATAVNPSGTITVLTPNGGVSMNALTNYNITWTADGTSGFYDLMYSTNGGASYGSIVSNITGTSYTWNVVNNPGSNVFVRVRDNQNTCRKDASDASNTIVVATPALTSPNGGELWNVNSAHNITWNTSTIITGGSVYIEFSTDNGTNWNIVTPSTSNTGSYSWTLPNTPTTQALIRISNLGYPSNYDVSNGTFTIQTPADFLTYPNGGETLRSQQPYNITWDANTFVSNVKLEYSLNSGISWNTITNSASNSGIYSWTTPQIVTTATCLVRITNTTVGTIQDVSNAVFTIQAPITLDYPSLSTSLTTCSSINIQWSRTTNFVNYSESSTSYRNFYELYYKVDNGSYNYITTVYNTSSLTGYSQSWTVPDVAPSTIKILIKGYWNTYQYGSPAVLYWQDSSDVAATAVNPSGTITVLTPNGGVSMNALTNYNITWTADGTSGFYDILYSVNGGATYSTIASNVTGTSYSWNVNNNPSTDIYVRVRDNQNTCRKDASNSANTIIAATPILTTPNGGEVWNVNSVQNITWNISSIIIGGSVFIEYSLDNGVTYNTVIASTSNTGNYAWTIPYIPTSQAKIRISVVGNTSLYDVSNATFTIQVPAPVMTSPNGGETWYAGEMKNITWLQSTYFSNTVNIDYSLDAGTTWASIASNQTNNGSYSWTLPSLNSANALIRVSNYTNSSVYDVSNALLTLRPWVRVITPNGGDQLGSCTQTTIAFEKAPTYTNFNLEYSVDNGISWLPIQTNQSYTNTINTYSWGIPNYPTTQALIRVTPYGVASRADISDAVFTIKRAVTIVQPNYGGVLVVGSSYPVKWLSDGISNIYDIAYSTSGPTGTYSNVVLGYNTSNNTYSWTVPNAPSSLCYLRIRDNVNSCKEDISDMAFTISTTANPITVAAPNGSDTLSACQSYNITWTESGPPIGNYNISYSIDYGLNWVPIVSNYITTSGIYNWIVPNISVSGALIRVQSGLNPLVYDYSNALFIIKPGRLYTNTDFTLCSGSSVQLTTTGGSNYSWSPSTGLSNSTIANPIAAPLSTVQYTVTSNSSGCFLQDTILITVIPSSGLSASVSISSSTGTAICSGTPVLFTATPINGGSFPVYQWKKNNADVGINTYTYSISDIASGDVINCIMTSSLQCVSNSPAISNALTMTVFPNVIPSVSISASSVSICSGTPVTFTSIPINGGASPVYHWKKNGVDIGANSNIYSDAALSNLDLISVEMLSNASCASPLIVTSNSILMTVNQNITPSVTISTTSNTICSGNNAVFTAVAVNAGTTPIYQWKLNGVDVGSNSSTFASMSFVNNNQISCVVLSSNICNTINPVTSNTILLTVLPTPSSPVASSNSPVNAGSSLQLFSSTVSNASYSWNGPGGFTSSSQNPIIPNATTLMSGTYYVTANVSGCLSPPANTVVAVSETPLPVMISGTIISETGSFINGVKLKRTGATVDSMYTLVDGQYNFTVTHGTSHVVSPSKNNDIINYNGISSFDIVLMQRHIGAAQFLNSPYKIISADINGSGTINVADIALTKSLILQNIASFPGNKLWAFVNSSYVFANPQNPFPYESTRSYSNVNTASDQNFIGLKLGDVNNSWDPSVAKILSMETLTMKTESAESLEGDIVSIPVKIQNFHAISGFQFTINWDASVLEFVETNNMALNMDYGFVHTPAGNLTALWATDDLNGVDLSDGSAIFTMKFRVIGHAGESSFISINSGITAVEAVNSNLEEVNVLVQEGIIKVIDATEIVENISDDFQLYQNEPNPFVGSTRISFSIPIQDEVIITIYDVLGKEVAEYKDTYSRGLHSIFLNGTDIIGNRLSVGTYYYRMQSRKFSKVRKMILLK